MPQGRVIRVRSCMDFKYFSLNARAIATVQVRIPLGPSECP